MLTTRGATSASRAYRRAEKYTAIFASVKGSPLYRENIKLRFSEGFEGLGFPVRTLRTFWEISRAEGNVSQAETKEIITVKTHSISGQLGRNNNYKGDQQ